MRPRAGTAALMAGVAVANLAVSCRSREPAAGAPPRPTPSGSPAGVPSATPTPIPSPVPSPVPSPSASGCTAIDTWSPAQKAALLIVAPVLNFTRASVQVAVDAGAGGILLLGSAPPPSNLAAVLHGNRGAQAGPAPLVMADEEGGAVQRLAGPVASMPAPRTMASTMTTAQVTALGAAVGAQMASLGVGVDLAPVLDVDGGAGPNATDADGTRSFSPDATTAARYGVAFLQELAQAKVLAVAKHFPGLGGASANTDYGPASTLPLSVLEGPDGGLAPYKAAIGAGVPAIMVSTAQVPGLSPSTPAALSPAVLSLLRGTLGFRGLVLTDSLSGAAIAATGDALPEAAVAAVEAGDDMVLFGSTLTPAQVALLSPANVKASIGQMVAALVSANARGALPTSRLDDAVTHVLAAHGAPCEG